VNDRQEGLGNLHVATLRDGGVGIAALAQPRVTAPVVRASKPLAPSGALKVGCARPLIGEQPLKLRQRVRKRQIVSFEHIDSHDSPMPMQLLSILPVVGCVTTR
jgi:hypothetical protein